MIQDQEEFVQKNLDDYKNYKVNDGPIKVENIKVFHGANYFSAGPIVLFRVDLGDFDEVFTNEISGFYEKLTSTIPTLYDHYCSIGKPGGFFQRVHDGTLLGHVIEHTAIELQTLAGMDVGYGKTRSTLKQGVYNIIFRYFDEEAGLYAGKAAVNLINSFLLDQKFDVKEIVKDLIDIRERRLFGPSTQAIVDMANRRDIPFFRLDSYNLVQLGTGKYHKRVRATITSDTSLIAVETADNKYLTSLMLKDAGIPVPETIKTDNLDEIIGFHENINAALVIKPIDSYLGKNSMVDISTKEEIISGFELAKEFSDFVLVQPFIKNANSYRFLVIDYKFVAAAELRPPRIIGNGLNSVKELIDILNNEPERMPGDKNKLSKVEIDIMTERILKAKNLTLESILPAGEALVIKKTGNPRLGGTSENVTAKVHPFNIFLAERAARVIGLNVAGVDILAESIETPINENGGVVLEVNAAPDFRMHINPAVGESINVAEHLINMLFPEGTKTRVPLFSITGTTGKTITARFLDHCLRKEGYKTGLTTSDGLFINNIPLMKGDMTYPEHVSLVLKDPTIDCAILETSREGIIRSGLGYKFADYGIVLNIYNEHVGQDDIKYIEDLAYAKSVVAEEVYEGGFTILNADIELVLEMRERLYSTLILFSKDSNNAEIKKHMLAGGMAVYINNDNICISGHDLLPLSEIPLCFENKAAMMYDEILASVAALAAHGIKQENIKKYLKEFKPDVENLPGRMNLINFSDYRILIDNAHNSEGFNGLKLFLDDFGDEKAGVIDAAGDRYDEEIIKLGNIAGKTYSKLFLYEGVDNRGRGKGEILALLKKGAVESGLSEEQIFVFEDLESACKNAISSMQRNQLLVILTADFEKIRALLNI